MKVLKWMLYIVLFIVALILIIPLFMPSTVVVTAEKDVAVTPAQVFHNAAMYTDRNKWDPWLETEPTAEFTLESSPDYVGSVYTWNGKKIKTGKMMVDSVVFAEYIASSIYFGGSPEPSLVEWHLEEIEFGTKVSWSFTADAPYPLGRLMLNLMKGGMEKSFSKGLENYAAYLMENPPSLSNLGLIEEKVLPPMTAIVIKASGTMEQFSEQMGEIYPRLYQEIGMQGLEMAGAPFSHYLSWDEETGITEYLCGIPVKGKAKKSGDIEVKSYKEMTVLQALHTGPYEDFTRSYEILLNHIADSGIEVTNQALEFYLTDIQNEPNPTKWKTLIAMPLK